ncbi:DUF6943 family protein [Chitinophaga varians]|uniref:DUF6943 family protein n=1 Tax=Chitinophaga varians TaxID=2202339 RepID=UPI00165F6B65|nr:hypothetical protein [Chitinophaga varians]MBC9909128.1 hypothetical protein [Chitinophaga varians]
MKNFRITSYDASAVHRNAPVFYILSRGLSAGMPTPEPYKHSFGFLCDANDRNEYYYYIYCLWRADIFQEYMSFEQIPELSPEEIYHAIEKNIRVLMEIEKCINVCYVVGNDTNPTLSKMKILEAAKNHLLFQKYNP